MIRVGLLGATGAVGKEYIRLLKNHPLFELTFVAASDASQGEKLTPDLALSSMQHYDEILEKCDLLFSALSDRVADGIVEEYARLGLFVISHSVSHRTHPLVPVIIPEINPHYIDLVKKQQSELGFKGGIIAKPNCTLQTFLLPLFPLHRLYHLEKVLVTTFQSVSGAGRNGPTALSLIDNLLPYIEGEEEKLEQEPRKILDHPDLIISSQACRVPITHGHFVSVSAKFRTTPDLDAVQKAWKSFETEKFPSSPERLFHYHDDPYRPQPRLDRDCDRGMAISLGRLRHCPVLDLRFNALSHNLIRGAAGGGLLAAETLIQGDLWSQKNSALREIPT